MITNENVCTSVQQVYETTKQLDKAKVVPISINDGGVIKQIDNWKGIYNISQGRMCACVAPNYTLVQHKEYFDNFATALSRLNIKFKMGLSQTTNRAFADIEFVGRNIKYTNLNEEFVTGLRLINSYDKTLSLSVGFRFTRLACLNGMIITQAKNTLHLKHTSKNLKDIEKFIELFIKNSVEQSNALKELINESIGDSIEWQYACKLLEHLFLQKKHRDMILTNLGIASIEVEEKGKKLIKYVWNDNSTQKEKFTRWDIYNAITNYITHGEHITPFLEEVYHQKAEQLFTTPFVVLERKLGKRQ